MLFSSHHLDEFVFTMSYKSRLSKVLVYMGKTIAERVSHESTHTHTHIIASNTLRALWCDTRGDNAAASAHTTRNKWQRKETTRKKKSHSNLSMSSSNKIDFNVGSFFFLHFYTVCMCVCVVCIEFRVLCVIWPSYTHIDAMRWWWVSHAHMICHFILVCHLNFARGSSINNINLFISVLGFIIKNMFRFERVVIFQIIEEF